MNLHAPGMLKMDLFWLKELHFLILLAFLDLIAKSVWCSNYCAEWSGEVRNITYSADGKSVSVVYRVTLYGTDAEVFAILYDSHYGIQPVNLFFMHARFINLATGLLSKCFTPCIF